MDRAQGAGPVAALEDVVRLRAEKVLNPRAAGAYGGVAGAEAVLVVLAAGKGTRFGRSPKCIQQVAGTPLARRSIDAFRRVLPAPAVCLVGYRHEEVAGALGEDNVYVLSDDPAGGTAFAACEAFCLPELAQGDPLLVITMGDRVVPPEVFRRLWRTHAAGPREADLTFLTAIYEPPRNRGKGRILRDAAGGVLRVVEDRDVAAEPDERTRAALAALTEGNCPLYVIRARRLRRCLARLTNDNAQRQYYLTDVIAAIRRDGGDIRTVTTAPADPAYELLCCDVTRPEDLAALEAALARGEALPGPDDPEIRRAAGTIAADRPAAQVASVARQLDALAAHVTRSDLPLDPARPIGVGVCGGRLRIAFMHPDMERFFGPAWQMPIGAGREEGDEQIVLLVQPRDDRTIRVHPAEPQYRESVDTVPDDERMYPGPQVTGPDAYEAFGTRMSEWLLASLGYVADAQLERWRREGRPLPPPSRWIGSNMRRPFTLIGNALASLRTRRDARVQEGLGRERFGGLSVASTGSIPQGGFSSSSAVTVATQNALNALYGLELPPDELVRLACQAEYGTGVRAGSLDQATEQKGRAGEGTLISSNPRDHYRVLGTYAVPTERIRILFPYSVGRDREAWRWSWGFYGRSAADGGPLTAGEMRKLTGKAAAIAAVLVRLPLETDFFQQIEGDLVRDGAMSRERRAWVAAVLRRLPLRIPREALRAEVLRNRDAYADSLRERGGSAAARDPGAALEALFDGWREPLLHRARPDGTVAREAGVPLRAIVGYLFGEVAKCFRLVHHPDRWIECVRASQRGDRCFDVDPGRLPPREALERALPWEAGARGPDLLDRWLERCEARPFDFDRGLDDASLAAAEPPAFEAMEGASFFRGLALIDLAEAMLHRAFGADAVAVRVNAAGQGDYFQVHVDTRAAQPDDVKRFLRAAFYRRFDLRPSPEFVELHPGGGAAGVRLGRLDSLHALAQALRRLGRP